MVELKANVRVGLFQNLFQVGSPLIGLGGRGIGKPDGKLNLIHMSSPLMIFPIW